MTGPLVTFVIPSYWPPLGRSVEFVRELAAILASSREPFRVRIVTTTGGASPGTVMLDNFEIIRVHQPGGFSWRRKSFARMAGQKIASWSEAPSVVVLFDSPEQGEELRGTLPDGIPLVVRFDAQLDMRPWSGSFANRRLAKSLAAADGVWVASSSQRLFLQECGIEPSSIRVIPDEISCDDPGTKSGRAISRREARRALSKLHPFLRVGAEKPMAVSMLPLSHSEGMEVLADTWQKVVRVCPEAVLWIVGPGVSSRSVIDILQHRNVDESVFLPGAFDNHDDLLAAANLYLHPAPSSEFTTPLLQAIRSKTPVVALESTESQLPWFQANELILLAKDVHEMTERIVSTMQDPGNAMRIASSAHDALPAAMAKSGWVSSLREVISTRSATVITEPKT